jgi:PAS domain S-box-containing protein
MKASPDESTVAPSRDSESRYRLLMEQAADGIAVYDHQGNILEANTRAYEMLGYTREELLSLTLLDVIDPDDLSANPIRWEQVQSRQTVLTERVLRHENIL